MKRALLAAAAFVSFGFARTDAEAAGIPVVCTTCPTAVQQALEHGKSLMEWVKQLRELQAIYSQAQLIYWAFTNIRDLGTAVAALQAVGISNPLPIDPYALQALMGGYGGPQGMIGNLGNLFSTNQQGLMVYQCNQGPWICDSMKRWRDSAAGTQAASMQLYTSAAQRAPQITALQAQIAAARTPAEREALTAQLTAVVAQTNNQAIQASAIQTFGQQQTAMREQQQEERLQQSIAEVLADARARGFR